MNRGLGKTFIFIFVLLLALSVSFNFGYQENLFKETGSGIFPGKTWLKYAAPGEAGWSPGKLKEAKKYYQEIGSAAVLIIYNGAVLVAWGEIERRFQCASIRKSYLSALYGIYVKQGKININQTLEHLKIDDDPPLSKEEKQARVMDLLKSKSGVYHPAASETRGMKERRPKRGSHQPNTFWYYNNWDFNTLGTIFQQETGEKIFSAYKKHIALPLQMEDFRLMDTDYNLDRLHSIHSAYHFKMSARDMARFGLLFLKNGFWNGKQLIPDEWIKESTTSYSDTGEGGYGYMWSISGDKRFKKFAMYSAEGAGGQRTDVLPSANLVFVHLADTYNGKYVNKTKSLRLLEMILNAKNSRSKTNPKLVPLVTKPKFTNLIQLDPAAMEKYIGNYKLNNGVRMRVSKKGAGLMVQFRSRFDLLPFSETKFIARDAEIPIEFNFDNQGRVITVSALFMNRVKQNGRPAKESIIDYMIAAITGKGIQAAVDAYHDLKKKSPDDYDFEESELNILGYQLLYAGRVEQAIEIFKLNVTAYPGSYDVYDSLAEAYTKYGDKEKAVKNYRKSLELNPENSNAIKMLKKLKTN